MKRIIAFTLALIMALSFVACDKTPADTTNADATDAGTAKPAETDAHVPTVSWDGINIAEPEVSGLTAYSGKVFIGWKQLEAPMASPDGALCVPLSLFCSSSGFTFAQNGDEATVKYGDEIFHFKAGADMCFKNGEKVPLASKIRISGDALYITDAGMTDIFGALSADSQLFGGKVISALTRTASVSGTAFSINGSLCPAVMYSGTQGSQTTWSNTAQKVIAQFSKAGIKIVQTDLWFKDIYLQDGSLDIAKVCRQIDGIKKVSPDASVVIRINLSAPDWWINQNPDECVVYTGGEIDSNDDAHKSRRVSLASTKWQSETDAKLKEFCELLTATPQGNSVIGLHLGGGVYGEWHYYGFFYEPDDSKPMRAAFSLYAKDKYKTVEAANTAWGKDFKSFEEIVVPSYNERYETDDGDYRDGKTDAYVIDYYKCQAKVVSTAVCGFAKTAHDAMGRDALIGVFYGYLYGAAANAGAGGETVGASASQMDIETILNCEYIDYIAGPYAARNLNNAGFYRSLIKSCTLHGKIFISENDETTCLGDLFNLSYPLACRDEVESVSVMRRNYMYSLTEGAGLWYYDFGPSNKSGAWSTPLMMKTAAELMAISEKQVKEGGESPADILVVYDMDAYYYAQPSKDDKLTAAMNFTLTNELYKTGAAFDRIFLFDLEKADLSQYKTVIFAACPLIDTETRDYIKNTVMKNGRNVVFMSGCGYVSENGNSVDGIISLTGITVEKFSGKMSLPTIKSDKISFSCSGIDAVFTVKDASATTVGTYKNGDVGAVKKASADCTVWYFGIPVADYEMLLKIFDAAGNKTYCEANGNDYISVGGGLICIYSARGGEKTLTLSDGSSVNVTIKETNTMYYSLSTGKPVTFDVSADDIVPEETDAVTTYAAPTGDVYGTMRDWSRNQGNKGWYSLYLKDGVYTEMVYRNDYSAYGITPTDESFCLNFKDRFHPGTDADAVKKWVVQKTGKIEISSTSKSGGICLPSPYTDGATVKIYYNSELVLDLIMASGDVYKDSIILDVFEGDVILFEVGRLGKNNDDTIEWEPLITYFE